MRNVVLYIAMSLDGYIADSDGGVAWLGGDGSDQDNHGSYPGFIKTVDTVIMGYTTYHQLITELAPEGWVYDDKLTYVITHRKIEATNKIIFTDDSLAELIEKIRNLPGRDIWICGGASIVNQALAGDLIDLFHITVIPTIMGSGIRLFNQGIPQQPLTLISTDCYNGMVELVYERRNPIE